MRVRELFQEYDTRVEFRPSDDWTSGEPEPEWESEGSYWSGRKSGEEYDLQLKLDKPYRQEGKSNYLMAVRKLQGVNPWVPIIHQARIQYSKSPLRKSDTPIRPRLQMETLLSYEQVGTTELYASLQDTMSTFFQINPGNFKSNFHNASRRVIQNYTDLKDHGEIIEDPDENENLALLFSYCIEKVCERPELYRGKLDPDLLQVANIIHGLVTKRNFNLDIHNENIMFRRSNNNLQPVISDPIV